MSDAIVICSGGLDSTVLLYHLRAQGYAPAVLSFAYGQKHVRELAYAQATCAKLHIPQRNITLDFLIGQLPGSALTDTHVAVPDGHYAADNMRSTIVPNRNALMLSIAVTCAVAQDVNIVALGVHAGDHPVYPDCRPAFLAAFEAQARLANDRPLRVLAPFQHLAKHDIVTCGASLEVDFRTTWSCYKGGERHCGTCGTCVERKEAFQLAGVTDPTDYLA